MQELNLLHPTWKSNSQKDNTLAQLSYILTTLSLGKP